MNTDLIELNKHNFNKQIHKHKGQANKGKKNLKSSLNLPKGQKGTSSNKRNRS